MGLFDSIEKLITEHGSATILKERIELANQQYGALEKKLAEAESRNEKLSARNKGLELDNNKLREQLRNLESQLEEKAEAKLDEINEKVLAALCGGHANLTAGQVAHQLNENREIIQFHLTELEQQNLVHSSMYYNGQETEWNISHEGRRYLIVNGLMKANIKQSG